MFNKPTKKRKRSLIVAVVIAALLDCAGTAFAQETITEESSTSESTDEQAAQTTDESPPTNKIEEQALKEEAQKQDEQSTTATPTPATETVEQKKKADTLTTVFETLDVEQETISSQVETIAKSIDSFFADDNVFQEATASYVRITLDTVFKKNGEMGFAGDLKVKLDLPRTKKRLKLLIESDPQSETKDDLENIPKQVAEEKNYFISLEREVNKQGRWDVRPALGIKARIPPDPFVRLRAIRYFDLDSWLLRVSANAFWFNSTGFGANSTFDFDHALSKTMLARSSTTYSWEEQDLFRRLEQVFSIYQNLDERQSLVYQVGLDATDEFDWNVEDYYARIRYRKDIHKHWLFAEISPQYTFLREMDYQPDRSITFRLEVVFGKGQP